MVVIRLSSRFHLNQLPNPLGAQEIEGPFPDVPLWTMGPDLHTCNHHTAYLAPTNLNSSFEAELKCFCVCKLFLKTFIPSQIHFLPSHFFLYEPYRGIGSAHICNIYDELGTALRTLNVHLQLVLLSPFPHEETESQRSWAILPS